MMLKFRAPYPMFFYSVRNEHLRGSLIYICLASVTP